MQDRFELPPPKDEMARIRELSYDLAYGALQRKWSEVLSVEYAGQNEVYFDQGGEGTDALRNYLENKWFWEHPGFKALAHLGFLFEKRQTFKTTFYTITSKAFNLLEEDNIPDTTAFISYGHQYSSAFGLLIEARLQGEGTQAFIDRSIPKGDDWHGHLKNTVEQCEFFICLIAPGTLTSEYVKREIQWADGNLRIPIWHPDYDYEAERDSYEEWLRDFVESKQAIKVYEESAEAYHDAVEKLINAIKVYRV